MDAARAYLLANLVETYLPLSVEEREELRVQLQEEGDTAVTTLPAKAGNFRAVRRPVLQQELLRLRTGQPLTLAPEGSIQAQCSGPWWSRRTTPGAGFPPYVPGGMNATLAGEHLKGLMPPSKRDRFYPAACPLEPPEPIVFVKVLSHDATMPVACQIAPASSADASFPSGLKPGVP